MDPLGWLQFPHDGRDGGGSEYQGKSMLHFLRLQKGQIKVLVHAHIRTYIACGAVVRNQEKRRRSRMLSRYIAFQTGNGLVGQKSPNFLGRIQAMSPYSGQFCLICICFPCELRSRAGEIPGSRSDVQSRFDRSAILPTTLLLLCTLRVLSFQLTPFALTSLQCLSM